MVKYYKPEFQPFEKKQQKGQADTVKYRRFIPYKYVFEIRHCLRQGLQLFAI